MAAPVVLDILILLFKDCSAINIVCSEMEMCTEHYISIYIYNVVEQHYLLHQSGTFNLRLLCTESLAAGSLCFTCLHIILTASSSVGGY